MRRVHIVAEGPTEETFIKNLLAPVFWSREIYLVPIILGIPGRKGGNTSYARVKKDILLQLKQDPSVYCSTMLDFYGLGTGFPGTPLPLGLSNIEKVTRLENAVREDITAELPRLRDDAKFIPYIQMHEFEGLLFSNPEAFAKGISKPQLAEQFRDVCRRFPTPEDINDSPNTAPSKRVLHAHPAYRKVVDGELAARAVGVEKMRQECPHFRQWLEQLEALA